MEQALDSIFWAPVDAVRRSLLRALGPLARWLIIDREARVTAFGLGIVAFCLAATTFFPLWLMALGPVLVGAPHLVGDIRYLVVRPGLHRTTGFWVAVAVPLAVAYFLPKGAIGMFAVAGALLISRASWNRRLIGLGVWAAGYLVLLKLGRVGTLSVLSGHNVLTLAIWWSWRDRKWGKEGWVLLAFVVASALILTGAINPLVLWAGGLQAPESGLTIRQLARNVLPMRFPHLAARLVLWYGFAQAVHYSTWVRLVPEDDRVRATPRTFLSSWRALHADFGTLGLAAAVLVSLGIAVWAVVDLKQARLGYLRAASFHFYLEIAVLSLCWAERHRPGKPRWDERPLPQPVEAAPLPLAVAR